MNTSKYDINIKDFLEYMGERVIPHGYTAYKLERHDSLIITKKRPDLFYWNSRSVGGGIDKLLENLYEIKGENKDRIINRFLKEYERDENNIQNDTSEYFKERKEYEVELKNDEKKILNYLSKERKINKDLITAFVLDEKIKLDKHNNVAFVIRDEDKNIKAFELVGTTSKKYKRNTSIHSEGFNIITKNKDCNNKSLYVFESAIDLISYVDLNFQKIEEKMKDENMQFLSLSGLRDDILNNYIDNKDKLVVCVDNDDAGNKFYEKLKNKIENINIEREIPIKKDWNEDLKEKNLFKDENKEELDNPWDKKKESKELER